MKRTEPTVHLYEGSDYLPANGGQSPPYSFRVGNMQMPSCNLGPDFLEEAEYEQSRLVEQAKQN